MDRGGVEAACQARARPRQAGGGGEAGLRRMERRPGGPASARGKVVSVMRETLRGPCVAVELAIHFNRAVPVSPAGRLVNLQ